MGRPLRGPAGCGIRAGGNAERPPGRIFRARRIARLFRRAKLEAVRVGWTTARSAGSRRLRAAAKGKLTDRALVVEFDAGHFREQVDVGAPDRTAAKRIGERAVLP
jgi:hypothetical protein